jgi:RNA recognition motif-containing protein
MKRPIIQIVLTEEPLIMNIYVGNLAYGTTDDDLRAAFAPYGAITSARVVFDKETGRSRGFGFVEMASQSEALAAIDALNQTELQGRQLRINEARPKR